MSYLWCAVIIVLFCITVLYVIPTTKGHWETCQYHSSREHDSTPTEIEISVKSSSVPVMQSTPNATAEQGTKPAADPHRQAYQHQFVFSSSVTISADDIQKIA